jgi:topoisomerase IA-like protein
VTINHLDNGWTQPRCNQPADAAETQTAKERTMETITLNNGIEMPSLWSPIGASPTTATAATITLGTFGREIPEA